VSYFPIFKAGTHITARGEKLTFSETDVRVMAAAYSPAVRPANLTIGHPADDLPRHGTAAGLEVRDGQLFAEVADVSETMKELTRSGRYRHVSAAFLAPSDARNPRPGSYYLKHIGMLGASLPAVKGLTPPQFTENPDDRTVVCFSEFAEFDVRELLFEEPDFNAPAGYLIGPYNRSDWMRARAWLRATAASNR